jgi:TetR/AcrR family transcriptional regulator
MGRVFVREATVSERDGGTTREAIVLSALRCFAEHGYAGTSLNDIAAEVGIRRPSLLHHFASKEALYGEVFERCLSEWLTRVEQGVASAGDRDDGWATLDAVLTASGDFFRTNPESVRLIRREAIDGGTNLVTDVGSALQPMFDRATRFLERQMGAGVFRRMSAPDLLISAYSALFGYFSDAPLLDGILGESALEPARVQAHMDHLGDLFRSALRPI